MLWSLVRRAFRGPGDVQTTGSGNTFVGTGNPSGCVDLLLEHVIRRVKEATSRCRPQSEWSAAAATCQPRLPTDRPFYAAGAFIYTLPAIHALDDDGVFVPAVGYQKAFEFCHLVTLDPLSARITGGQRGPGPFDSAAGPLRFLEKKRMEGAWFWPCCCYLFCL